jgi:hypothetical protein
VVATAAAIKVVPHEEVLGPQRVNQQVDDAGVATHVPLRASSTRQASSEPRSYAYSSRALARLSSGDALAWQLN